MILTHGANSLSHGFTPKPIPSGYTRIAGIRKTNYHVSGGYINYIEVPFGNLLTNVDTEFILKFSMSSNSPTDNSIQLYYVPDGKLVAEYNRWLDGSTDILDLYLCNSNSSTNNTRIQSDIPDVTKVTTLSVKNGSGSLNTIPLYSTYAAQNNFAKIDFFSGQFWNRIGWTFYGFDAINNGNMLCSCIPVKSATTNECAIFDLVSGNIGTPRSNPRDYVPVEGIEIGGRIYPTVQMPDGRIWLGLNLDFAWDGLPVGVSGMPSTPNAWYNFDNESTWGWNGYKCGLLYNGAAISYLETNKATLIPGWHVPTYAEWGDLFVALGGASVAGTKLKATNDVAYPMYSENWNGTDDFGMSILPSGYRWASDSFVNGVNNGSRYAVSDVNYYAMFDGSASTGRWTHNSAEGIAIRLVKDAT